MARDIPPTNHQIMPPTDSSAPDATEMLRRIGWQPSDWQQIEVVARMSPARKIAEMLKWRSEAIRLLNARLRREHPNYDEVQLARLLQEHLDLVREKPFVD